jgi:monovalent cation/proton antiporter MnhG/PhaG subunit
VTGQQVFADILLVLAAVTVLVSAVGILVMRDTYQKLHYVTPIAVLAPLLVGLAVLTRSGWSENSSVTWLALLFVMMGGPVVAHATIRAARIREHGDWRPGDWPEKARTGERTGGRSHG